MKKSKVSPGSVYSYFMRRSDDGKVIFKSIQTRTMKLEKKKINKGE